MDSNTSLSEILEISDSLTIDRLRIILFSGQFGFITEKKIGGPVIHIQVAEKLTELGYMVRSDRDFQGKLNTDDGIQFYRLTPEGEDLLMMLSEFEEL